VYIFVIKLLRKQYPQWIALEKQSVSRKKFSGCSELRKCTVMVTHIPNSLAQMSEELKEVFSEIWGDSNIRWACLVPQAATLYKLQEKRLKVFKRWLRECEVVAEQKKRKACWVFLEKKCSRTADPVDYYKTQMDALDKEISQFKQAGFRKASTGFVTFTSERLAMACAQTLHHRNPFQMKITAMPHPNDINWKWIGLSPLEFGVRYTISWGFVILLFAFWSLPIVAISSYDRLDELLLSDTFRQLRQGTFAEFVGAFATTVLPVLLVMLFLGIVPYIIQFLLYHCAFLLNSRWVRTTAKTFWLFLFLNVLLVSIVASPVRQIITDILRNPRNIVDLLALSLPVQAAYILRYLVLQSCIEYPWLRLCRIHHYFFLNRLRKLFAKTCREKFQLEEPRPFQYAKQYGRELLAFTLGICYSTMNPLILPVTALYFVLAWLTAKYNFIYVFVPAYENLKMTIVAVDRVEISLIFYQLAMTGLFSLKLFPEGAIVCFVLAIFTFLFRMFIDFRFFRPARYVALMECPDKPAHDQGAAQKWLVRHYTHPALYSPGYFAMCQATFICERFPLKSEYEDFGRKESIPKYTFSE